MDQIIDEESLRRQVNGEDALKAAIFKIIDDISKQPYEFTEYEMHDNTKKQDIPPMIFKYDVRSAPSNTTLANLFYFSMVILAS